MKLETQPSKTNDSDIGAFAALKSENNESTSARSRFGTLLASSDDTSATKSNSTKDNAPKTFDGTTIKPSVTYSAADSLTVEYLDQATGDWKQIDTKPGGKGSQGIGNLASFDIDGDMSDLKVRLKDNSTNQIIGMDNDQARVTRQADGTIVIAFEDRPNGDKDFNDAVVTLKSNGSNSGLNVKDTSAVTNASTDTFGPEILTSLLEALSEFSELIKNADIPEGRRNQLLDKIEEVLSSITVALSKKDGGSSQIDEGELSDVLDKTQYLMDDFEIIMPDSDKKNAALDDLNTSIGEISEEIGSRDDDKSSTFVAESNDEIKQQIERTEQERRDADATLQDVVPSGNFA